MFERTNLDRAQRAESALETYNGTDSREDGNEGRDELLGDLLGDLRHYCRLYGLDFDSISARGFAMSEQERLEDFDGADFAIPQPPIECEDEEDEEDEEDDDSGDEENAAGAGARDYDVGG